MSPWKSSYTFQNRFCLCQKLVVSILSRSFLVVGIELSVSSLLLRNHCIALISSLTSALQSAEHIHDNDISTLEVSRTTLCTRFSYFKVVSRVRDPKHYLVWNGQQSVHIAMERSTSDITTVIDLKRTSEDRKRKDELRTMWINWSQLNLAAP